MRQFTPERLSLQERYTHYQLSVLNVSCPPEKNGIKPPINAHALSPFAMLYPSKAQPKNAMAASPTFLSKSFSADVDLIAPTYRCTE